MGIIKRILIITILTTILCPFIYAQEIKTLDGENVSLNNIVDEDKPTVIIVFTIWNGYSIKLIRELSKEYNNIPKDKIKIIAIALDAKRSGIKNIENRSREWPFTTFVCDDWSIADYLCDQYYQYLGIERNTTLSVPTVFRCYKTNTNLNTIQVNRFRPGSENVLELITSIPYNNNKYTYVEYLDGNRFKVIIKDKVGVVDNHDNIIVPIQYDGLGYLPNLYFGVQQNGKVGLLDMQGKVVIPIIYDELNYINAKSIIAKKNGKYGVINDDNNIIIPFEYEEINIKTDFIIAKKNGKYGVINDNNNTIIPFEYEEIDIKSGSFFTLKRNSKYGIADSIGKTVFTPQFDTLQICDKRGEYIIAHKNGNYGCVNFKGGIVIPFNYSELNYCGENYFIAKKEKYGLINARGTIIHDFTADEIYASFRPDKVFGDLYVFRKGDIWLARKTNGKCVVASLTYDTENQAIGSGMLLLFKAKKEGLDKVDCSTVDSDFLFNHTYHYNVGEL